MDEQRKRQWQEILVVSEQLYSLAQAEEWDELTNLYRQRDLMIQSFFSVQRPDDEDESGFLKQAIPELMAKDEELRMLCTASRDEAAQALGKVSIGRKADAAYNQNR